MQQKRNGLPARHELKYFINPAEVEVLRAPAQAGAGTWTATAWAGGPM